MLLIVFILLIVLVSTYIGNNLGIWRIQNSSDLVEIKYGAKMENWRLDNLYLIESYKISVYPMRLNEARNPLNLLNTRVIVTYFKVEAQNRTKTELLGKEVVAKEFVFIVNPISGEIEPSSKTEKTLKNY